MIEHAFHLSSAGYTICLLAGLVLTAWYWSRRFKSDPRMMAVYAGGLLGALLGAKVGYVLAEAPIWWGQEHFLDRMLVGKTVLGSLLLGYAGVELGKKVAGVTQSTGDSFACVTPFGMAIGRIGCLLHGCCLGYAVEGGRWWTVTGPDGQPHYPAPLAELIFNVVLGCVLVALARRGKLRGNLFHLYLIAYGLFRFGHEFVRDTPRYPGTLISPYMGLALLCVALGVWRWRKRNYRTTAETPTPTNTTN